MDNDSYQNEVMDYDTNDNFSRLVEFEANYSRLIEQCFATERPNNGPRGARSTHHAGTGPHADSVTTRPQGKTQSVPPATGGTTGENSGAETSATTTTATTGTTGGAATVGARQR